MNSYNIDFKANNGAFWDAKSRIEKAFPNAQTEELLVDVDGSYIQEYSVDGKKIKLHNDYYVDALYCDSEINLDNVLQYKKKA